MLLSTCVEQSFRRVMQWWHVLGRKLVAEQSSWACLGSRTGSLEHLSPLWPLDTSIYSEGYIPGSNLAVISLASIFQNLLRISLAWKEKELVPKAPRG